MEDNKYPDLVYAPWTEEQVTALNRYQANPYRHPYTCGNEHVKTVLVATISGWDCPFCHQWVQNWASNFLFQEPTPEEIRLWERLDHGVIQ